MIKKLRKRSAPGIWVWNINVQTPEKRVNTNVELSEAEAHAIHSELLGLRARAKLGLPTNATTSPFGKVTKLSEACALYESDIRSQGMNPVHITNVIFNLDLLKKVVGEGFPVSGISREHLREWRRKRAEPTPGRFHPNPRKPGASTINKGAANLSAFFNWAIQEGYTENNPVLALGRIKQAPPEMRFVYWKDFCATVDRAWDERPAFALLLEVLGETGARADELIGAELKEININGRTWTKIVKPGDKRVNIDVGDWTVFAAKTAKARGFKNLLVAEDKKPWSYTLMNDLIKKYSGNGFTAHYVRHGRACWDLASGKDVWSVKTKLGHASVTTTEGYLRAADVLKREEGTFERVRYCTFPDNFPRFSMLSNAFGRPLENRTKENPHKT